MTPARLRAYLDLILVSLIWGIAGPVIKLTLQEFPPHIFLIYRFFISTIFSLIYFSFNKSGLKFITIKNFPILFLYTFFNSTITLGLLFWGTQKTSLLEMSLISLFSPLTTIAGGYFFLNEHITKREKTGIILSFFGSLILIFEPLSKTKQITPSLWGNILIFASLISNAIAGIALKKLLRQGIEPFSLSNLSFIVGFLSLLPIAFVKETSFDSILKAPLPYHMGVLYMALFSGTIAYFLFNKSIKTIELSEGALFSYLHPVYSAFLAILLLKERPSLTLLLGSIITIIGIGVAQVKIKRYNKALNEKNTSKNL